MGRAIYHLEVWTKPATLTPKIEAIPARTLSIPGVVELRQQYTYAEVDDAEQRTGKHTFSQQDLEYARLWVDSEWYKIIGFGGWLENMRGHQELKYYAEDLWGT